MEYIINNILVKTTISFQIQRREVFFDNEMGVVLRGKWHVSESYSTAEGMFDAWICKYKGMNNNEPMITGSVEKKANYSSYQYRYYIDVKQHIYS